MAVDYTLRCLRPITIRLGREHSRPHSPLLRIGLRSPRLRRFSPSAGSRSTAASMYRWWTTGPTPGVSNACCKPDICLVLARSSCYPIVQILLGCALRARRRVFVWRAPTVDGGPRDCLLLDDLPDPSRIHDQRARQPARRMDRRAEPRVLRARVHLHDGRAVFDAVVDRACTFTSRASGATASRAFVVGHVALPGARHFSSGRSACCCCSPRSPRSTSTNVLVAGGPSVLAAAGHRRCVRRLPCSGSSCPWSPRPTLP